MAAMVSHTFAVPTLSGRVPIHQGQGPGLSRYVIGQMAGSEGVTLIPQQMPQHNHSITATTTGADVKSVGPTVQLGTATGDAMYVTDTAGATPYISAPQSTQTMWWELAARQHNADTDSAVLHRLGGNFPLAGLSPRSGLFMETGSPSRLQGHSND